MFVPQERAFPGADNPRRDMRRTTQIDDQRYRAGQLITHRLLNGDGGQIVGKRPWIDVIHVYNSVVVGRIYVDWHKKRSKVHHTTFYSIILIAAECSIR